MQDVLRPLRDRNSYAVTANVTLGRQQVADCLVHNTGATGTVVVGLPPGTARMKARFLRTAAFTLTIDPNGTEIIKGADGVSLGAGVAKDLTAAGAYLELEHDGVAWNVIAERAAATPAEIDALADVTPGTSAASKALVLDADGDITSGPVVLADMTEGSGITGASGGSIEHSVERVGGLFKTTILVDLAGLNSGGTANDIIGKAAAANCHLGQITAAKNGTIFAGLVTCLETPTTGDDDIDLYSATVATGVEDTPVTDLADDAQLCNSGNLTSASRIPLTAFPAANSYLYLAGGTGDSNATYATGILLIELWGK